MKKLLLTLALLTFSLPAFAQGTGGTGNQLSIQGLMTLTTNGSSGASTLTGKTLNIPVYSGGGGSLAISNTTSNVTYRPLFATSTSASASTIYIDGTSPWSYNASTGLTSILGVTTTSLTVNGNTSLSGTTTANNLTVTGTCTGCGSGAATLADTTSAVNYYLGMTTTTSGSLSTLYGTASKLFFNASTGTLNALAITSTTITGVNASLSGTTTTANLVVTTALTDTAMASGLIISTTGVLSSVTTVPASYRPVGAVAIQPSSLAAVTTSGNIYPTIYSGAGGNAAPNEYGWGTVASLSADSVLSFRFALPSLIPQGTMNLVSNCLANASSGTAKYTVSDAVVASGSSPSAASLTGETQTSLSITTTDAYLRTATPLTPSAVANSTLVGAVTFNTTGWTLASQLVCRWTLQWL